MKRYHSLILACFAAMLLALPARAYGDEAFAALPFGEAEAGFVTVITDTQGAVHRFDGALDAAALSDHGTAAARIASYALSFEDDTLLSVTLHDVAAEAEEDFGLLSVGSGVSEMTNGYSSASFDYDTAPYKGCEVFLTGLKLTELSELTSKLTLSAAEYTTFDLTELSFIDAEKTTTTASDQDALMCWAATTSNLLHYTGWASKADATLTSEDLVFDHFAANFNNGFGNVNYGLQWFFDGTYPANLSDGWATLREGGSAGGYLKDYPSQFYSSVVGFYAVPDKPEQDPPEEIRTVAQKLREGYGVGVSLGWYKDETTADNDTTLSATADGGHAITLWGYIRTKDEESGEFSRGNYLALLTADSDTNPTNPRTNAPDRLCLMPLKVCDATLTGGTYETQTHESWRVEASSGKYGILQEFILLQPYDESYEKDTGTHTSDTSPDLIIGSIYISDGPHDIPNQYGIFQEDSRTVYTAGNELLVSLWTISNIGSANYSGNVSYSAALRAEGEDAFTPIEGYGVMSLTGVLGAGADGLKALNTISGTNNTALPLGPLSAGNYTLRVTIAMNEACKEAYSLNNSYEVEFTVADGSDMGNARISVAGAMSLYQKPYYSLPLSISGVSADFAEHIVITITYYQDNAWYTDFYDKSCQTFSLTPTVLTQKPSKIRVHLLFQSSENASSPWPTLEAEICLWDVKYLSYNTSSNYAGYQFNRAENTLTCNCRLGNQHACVAAYDDDGRMVYCRMVAHGETLQLNTEEALPLLTASSIKVFCLDNNSIPQYACKETTLIE